MTFNPNDKLDVQWVKTSVGKASKKYYEDHPGYYLLNKTDYGSVFAFRKVGDSLDHHLELCSPHEIDRLEKKRLS